MKNNKRLFCLLLAGVLAVTSGQYAFAATSTEVQKEQTETKNKLNEINQSITAMEKKRKEVQSQLSNLNEDLVETILTLELLEADLENKQAEIDEAQAEYDRLKKLEEEQYENMKLRIRYMYEQGANDYISMLLEADSLTDLVNRADFAREISNYDDEKIKEYEEIEDLVAETKAELEEEKAELEEVQEAQQAYQAELNSEISTAKSKVKNFEAELANAQSKAKEYQQTIKEQTALINKLQKEEKEKAEKEKAEREKAEREKENAGATTENPTNGGNSNSSSSNGQSTGASVSGSGKGAQIASYALQFVGNPYVSGGTSLTNGADCSGFTYAVFQHFGITLPRRSDDQGYGGKNISLGSIQAGDIIYYGGHVGIYIGNGKIVHASTKKTGIKISNYTYRPPISARRYW